MSRQRQSTGGIVEKRTSRGISFHARFRALGRRRSVYVGNSADGITRDDAERTLIYHLEQVKRGDWQPVVEQLVLETRVPSFREAASDHFAARKIEGGRNGKGLAPRSVEDLEWRLGHLLRAFGDRPLDTIDVKAVEDYRRRLVREGRLASRSINRTLEVLAAIFEEALDHGSVQGRNPASGRKRRLPVEKTARPFINSAAAIEALLDAAGDLDGKRRGVPYRRPALSTLILCGLRVGELIDLRWADVHLASARVHVRHGKTAAAARDVDLLPLALDELKALKAASPAHDGYVFATSTGGKLSPTNLRRRVLAPAVEAANETLVAAELTPLPERLSPHGLRRTFASVLYALGETPPRVMEQLGHATPQLALSIYAKAMTRREGEAERLAVLVGREREITGNGETASATSDRTTTEASR